MPRLGKVRNLVLALGLAAVSLGFASSAAGQAAAPAATVQTPDEALAQDAAQYARTSALPPAEALRRLRAQQETVAATDALEREFKKRLAGISIEQRPDYRIQVLLTGAKPVPDRVVTAAGMSVPIRFRTGARDTRARLVEAIRKRAKAIRNAVPESRGIGVDQRSGVLVVMLSEPEDPATDLAALAARAQDAARVTTRLRIIERPETNFGVEGGVRVEGIDTVSGRRAYCTSGFVVTDGARTGIVTAAHCPDALTYVAPDGRRLDLPFIGQWGWSYQDVQLNVSDEAQQPLFFSDYTQRTARPLIGERGRRSTRAGDIVCHRGLRSGYSCAEVELTDYAPPGDLCGGPCEPVWVTVAGPSCGGGDSGGPVFSGTTGYGIVKGGTTTRSGGCAFYYYMSLDYLPAGWKLLHGTAARPEAAPSAEPPAAEPADPAG